MIMRCDSGKHRSGLCALAMVAGMYCHDGTGPELPYVPQAVFTGYINSEFDSLAGNRSWPNRCELVGDTVRIFCYSTFFSESNRIRHGDLMRIDLLPDSGRGFEKRNTLFHLARYYERNESYTINKGDTVDNSIRFESEIKTFSRAIGGEVVLEEMYVATPPVIAGQYLEIKDGHLSGSIHHP
ncbi:MAG: hypothetical protein JXA18_08670 [Chitinispirillaceae bacterium]|nr:hypothetical protein [Chitinispirillaceae bacterium]